MTSSLPLDPSFKIFSFYEIWMQLFLLISKIFHQFKTNYPKQKNKKNKNKNSGRFKDQRQKVHI